MLSVRKILEGNPDPVEKVLEDSYVKKYNNLCLGLACCLLCAVSGERTMSGIVSFELDH